MASADSARPHVLCVDVAYATAQVQEVVRVQVAPGSDVRAAIDASGLCARHPAIDLSVSPVGIYGECVRLTDPVRDGDRVEIYRHLHTDPKLARRRRVAVKKAPRRTSSR
jgi:putative ubiquitin-RnfH superfamily antitoxin RatB of RatAB toxin-antitoxin module